MERLRQAEPRAQEHAGSPRPSRPELDKECALLFEEAVAGIEAGYRPAWLPTWAYRKARSLRRRRTLSRRWLGEHLPFLEDIAMREARTRHGIAAEPGAPTPRRSRAPRTAGARR